MPGYFGLDVIQGGRQFANAQFAFRDEQGKNTAARRVADDIENKPVIHKNQYTPYRIYVNKHIVTMLIAATHRAGGGVTGFGSLPRSLSDSGSTNS